MLELVLLVINFIVVSTVINALQRLYMRITGADVLFFDGGKKFGLIFIISFALLGAGL